MLVLKITNGKWTPGTVNVEPVEMRKEEIRFVHLTFADDFSPVSPNQGDISVRSSLSD